MINSLKRVKSDVSEDKIIDQLKCLGIDMINEAQSGHPGIVLGAAPILYTLYAHHLRYDTTNPSYFNRDRFIMSAGHGSALLYATLYMAGFDISLDDLKNFRQIDSITPGHPELGVTPGVDMTTGPLGQGIATAVGVAMSEAYLESYFNRNKKKIIDFNTYVLCGDGDLMEGISYEAVSLAGTLKLNKLIVLYDSNHICLDGETNLTFNDNIPSRFMASGWNVIIVNDGEDYNAISNAINEAKTNSDKPTLIEIKTTIGKGSVLEGTNAVHGSPLKREDIAQIKEKLKLRDIPFSISQTTLEDFQLLIEDRCLNLNEEFLRTIDGLDEDLKNDLMQFISGDKHISLNDFIYDAPDELIESPRDTSAKILNFISNNNSFVIGGSADLFAANKTYVHDVGDFSASNYLGKNIYFGVREGAMGAILNGLAICGFRPYGSTFLSFSDYLRPAMRLSCMLNLKNLYIFTHDSISVGEDGPTHQPVEQLLSLRSMPNLEVFRPADANEVIGSYKVIFEESDGPCAIALSRNKLPILGETSASAVTRGGYIAFDTIRIPDGIVMTTGEELHQVIEAAKILRTKGIEIRVVSIPCLSRFLKQDSEYIDNILPVQIKKIAVEAASSFSWNSLIFDDKYLITLDRFGASGKKEDVYKKFGFDVENLTEKIENLLK